MELSGRLMRLVPVSYSLNFLRDFSLNENAEQELLKVVENSPRSFDEIRSFLKAEE